MTSKFGSDLFIDRHLGLGDNDERIMLNKLGFNNIDQFINQVIPEDIQIKDKSSEILPQGCSEIEALNELEEIANKNIKISLNLLKNFSQSWPKHEKPEKWIVKNKNSITEKINYKFKK